MWHPRLAWPWLLGLALCLRARWSEQREQAAAGPSVVLARAEASSRSGPQLGQGGTQQSHSNPHPTFSPTLLPEYLRTQLKSRGTQQLLNSYVTQPARKWFDWLGSLRGWAWRSCWLFGPWQQFFSIIYFLSNYSFKFKLCAIIKFWPNTIFEIVLFAKPFISNWLVRVQSFLSYLIISAQS